MSLHPFVVRELARSDLYLHIVYVIADSLAFAAIMNIVGPSYDFFTSRMLEDFRSKLLFRYIFFMFKKGYSMKRSISFLSKYRCWFRFYFPLCMSIIDSFKDQLIYIIYYLLNIYILNFINFIVNKFHTELTIFDC